MKNSSYKKSVKYSFNTKGLFLWYFSKFIFCFFTYKKNIFSDWLENYIKSIKNLETFLLELYIIYSIELFIDQQKNLNLLILKKIIKNYFVLINGFSSFKSNNLYYKYIYYFFNFHFLTSNWRFFRVSLKKEKKILKAIKVKNLKIKLKKKIKKVSNKGKLYITFSKRNMFLNISDFKNTCLMVTTLRRLGYIGRRRQEYTSIFSAIRSIKKKLFLYKLKRIAIIYNGWNKVRIAVKNSLRYWDKYKVPILYIKYTIKIPHNGCRQKKKKRKKRKRTIRIKPKKKLNKKSYFVTKMDKYIKKLRIKNELDVKKKYFQKNKNV